MGSHLKAVIDFAQLFPPDPASGEAVVTPADVVQRLPEGLDRFVGEKARIEIECRLGVVFAEKFRQAEIGVDSVVPALHDLEHRFVSLICCIAVPGFRLYISGKRNILP